jgi:RNA polymerase sigma-70 factor, ECF subfamily
MELFTWLLRIQDESPAVQECRLAASMDKLRHRSDAELLQLSLAGEENAFLVLYERLKSGIFRYAFYMTNSRPAAEEVTQEVFIALLENGQRYREAQGNVAAFAFGIARNFVRRMERRERAYQPLPAEETMERLPGRRASEPEILPEQLIRGEVVESVRAAIASLPEHYRQVVVLCDLCELSYEQAASRLECAVGTVRSRLSRGHALLAQKLKVGKKPQAAFGTAGTEGCLI